MSDTPHSDGVPSPIALDIARELTRRWAVGRHFTFCDDDDFDHAGESAVATAIDAILLPRLAAHAGKIDARVKVLTAALQEMGDMDPTWRGHVKAVLGDDWKDNS